VAITYDPAKNERNIRERRLSFERAADFDFATAVFHTEIRNGELRRIAALSAFAKPTRGRQSVMAKRKPLTDAEGEVRELKASDAAAAKPFSSLPEAERKLLLSLRRRGAQKTPRKVPVSIRLSPDVADGLRATGRGWQHRADEALRSWLRRTKADAAG
jgi:uncharacterized protein (DUF4415 family)